MFQALARHFPEQYFRGVPGLRLGSVLEQTSQYRLGMHPLQLLHGQISGGFDIRHERAELGAIVRIH